MSQTVPMTANFPGLVRLLAEHLYPERGVFLREMIQNAQDSICRRQDTTLGHQGRIDVIVDAARKTIAFVDNGLGMTSEEIVRYLTVFGESGTDEYRRRMKEQGREGVERLIGQFGIGLLSGFLVADRIAVETRRSPESLAYRWTYQGGASSTLEEIPTSDLREGTRVTLNVTMEQRQFLQTDVLREWLVRYADFIPFPIFMNRSATPINTQQAPWHRTFAVDELRIREYNRFVARRFPDTPLEIIPVDLNEPYRVQGVLYISDRRIPDAASTGTLDVYCKRMFICAGDAHLLPAWAKFVRGVIDSPDITVTASRCDVQRGHPTYKAIQDALSALIVDHLKDLSKRDERLFQRIMRWHHYHVRGMAIEHDEFFTAVAELVPFETSVGGDQSLMNLRQYLAKQPAPGENGRWPIFYFTEVGAAAQFNEMCSARGIIVINAGYLFDEAFLKKYQEAHADAIELRRLDAGGSSWLFQALKPDEAERFQLLVREFQRLLNSTSSFGPVHVQAERFFPTDWAAVITLSERSEARRRLRELQNHPLLGESFSAFASEVADGIEGEPVVLHLNAESLLIERLAAARIDDDLRPLLVAIFNNAILLSSQLQSEQNLKSLYRQSMGLIEILLDRRQQLLTVQKEVEDLRSRLRERH